MARLQFPKVVAAAKAAEEASRHAEGCLWQIGDALIAECGPPGKHGVNTGTNDKIRQVAAELKQLGFAVKYSFGHLIRLRENSAAFTDSHRCESEASWTAHHEARDPQTLRRVITEAKRQNKRVTVGFVKNCRKRWLKTVDDRERDKSSGGVETSTSTAKAAKDNALHAAAKAQGLAAQFEGYLRPQIDRQSELDVQQLIKAANDVSMAWSKRVAALRDLLDVELKEAAE